MENTWRRPPSFGPRPKLTRCCRPYPDPHFYPSQPKQKNPCLGVAGHGVSQIGGVGLSGEPRLGIQEGFQGLLLGLPPGLIVGCYKREAKRKRNPIPCFLCRVVHFCETTGNLLVSSGKRLLCLICNLSLPWFLSSINSHQGQKL